jgi:hypothetical protein
LLTVLHRQGFCSIGDVDRCVIEPGGGFFIQGKTPPAAEIHHAELIKRLEELTAKVEALAGGR